MTNTVAPSSWRCKFLPMVRVFVTAWQLEPHLHIRPDFGINARRFIARELLRTFGPKGIDVNRPIVCTVYQERVELDSRLGFWSSDTDGTIIGERWDVRSRVSHYLDSIAYKGKTIKVSYLYQEDIENTTKSTGMHGQPD